MKKEQNSPQEEIVEPDYIGTNSRLLPEEREMAFWRQR